MFNPEYDLNSRVAIARRLASLNLVLLRVKV